MFEDVQNEPEDLFAQTDAAAPQVPPPTQAMPPNPPPAAPAPSPMPAPAQPIAQTPPPAPAKMDTPMETVATKSSSVKVVIMIVAILVVIGAAFLLSMRILNSKTPVTPEPPITNTEETAPGVETTPVPEVAAPVIEKTVVDSDKDGLSDDQEAQLGTNPNNPDTDADGLFDKEEVEVYKTNPLNPDTDGDTYKDGDEVSKGYNPNGQGKLTDIPKTP